MNLNIENKEEVVRCPECGSQARMFLYSTTTCLGYAPFYYDEAGVRHINPNPNITSYHWQCTGCGIQYTT